MPFSRLIDMTGRKHGRLTVIQRSPKPEFRAQWQCRCDCGKVVIVDGVKLRSGHTKSCGCLRDHLFNQRIFKHGETESVEYETWCRMKDRCLNPRNPEFRNYGGRGITISPQWVNNFPQFLLDIGRRPLSTSIDRINVDGNYEPGNCRWANATIQRHNQRPRPSYATLYHALKNAPEYGVDNEC